LSWWVSPNAARNNCSKGEFEAFKAGQFSLKKEHSSHYFNQSFRKHNKTRHISCKASSSRDLQKMSQKTSSSTIIVGAWTFIFFNRPANNDIEYVKFKSPTKAQKGRIGTSGGPIVANEGAIATILVTGSTEARDILLYYISPDLVIKEIKLRDAHLEDVNINSGWIEQGPDLTFEKGVDGAVRSVDASSFVSVSTRNNYPVVSFAPKGQTDTVRYCWYTDDDGWANTLLKF
jgi:hypothetical protein